MNKIVLGLLLGGFLGIFDGLTAWFTPEVRSQLLGIVIGSTAVPTAIHSGRRPSSMQVYSAAKYKRIPRENGVWPNARLVR